MKGDFAGLARLQAKIKSLATKDTQIQMANVIGAAALSELQMGFRASTDPYGRPWAPLKLRAGGKPLLDTGRLRSSFSYQPKRGGFTIGTNFIGANVHQYGATITPKRGKFLRFKGKIHGRTRRTTGFIFAKSVTIPRRQMVPEGNLGERWSKAFDGAAERFMSRIMRG
jgi:phage gpG-like protein